MSFLPILLSLALLLLQVRGTRVMLSTRLCSAYLSRKLFHPKQGEAHATDQYWFSARHSGGTYARVFAKALNKMKFTPDTCEVNEQPTGTALIVNSETTYNGNWELFLDTAFKDANLQTFNQGEVVGVEIFGSVGSGTFPTNYAVIFFTTKTQLRFLNMMHDLFPFKLSIPAMVEGLEQRRQFVETKDVAESKFLVLPYRMDIPQNVDNSAKNKTQRSSVKNTHKGKTSPKKNVVDPVLQGNVTRGRRSARGLDDFATNYATTIVGKIKTNEKILTSGLLSSASSAQTASSPLPFTTPSLGVVYWEHKEILFIVVVFDEENVRNFDLDSITTGGFLDTALLKLGEKNWFSVAYVNFANKEQYPASKFAGFQATECIHSVGLLSSQDFYYIPGIVVAIRSKSNIERAMDAKMMLEMLNELFDPRVMIAYESVPIYGAGIDFWEDFRTGVAYMVVVIIRDSKLLTHIYSLDPSILISAKAVRVAVEAYDRFHRKPINSNVATFDLPIYAASSNRQSNEEMKLAEVLISAKRGNIDKTGEINVSGKANNMDQEAVTDWKAYAYSVWFEGNDKLILAKVFDDVAQNYETLEVLTNSRKK